MPSNKKRRALVAKKEVEEMPEFRPPPAGLMENEYALCKQTLDGATCQFGVFCISAHSVGELQEWKKCFIEKTTIEIKKNKSLAAKLLEQMEINKNSKIVLPEVPNIVCTYDPDLHSYIYKTPFAIEWRFLLHSYSPLLNVFLLHEETKEHFLITEVCKLQAPDGEHFTRSDDDEWTNTDWEADKQSDSYQYSVALGFNTAIFGSFRQSIIFDFGFYPMLQKDIMLDVKPDSDSDSDDVEVRPCQLIASQEIWSPKNTTIIPFGQDDDENDELLKKYPLVKSQAEPPVHDVSTLEAYRRKMHYYLSLEEFARFQIMSRFNVAIDMECLQSYCRSESLSSLAKYAQNGERFGRLPFSSNISEDTEYGKTLLSCSSLLISKNTTKREKSKRRAFMSTIENFSKNEIFVNLSKQMVRELGCKDGQWTSVNIQFILNRLNYCEIHQSLDRIECFEHIYPDISSIPTVRWDTYKQFALLKAANLNVKQREAIIAMVSPAVDILPPVVIIGPYGTGKTFTLANAIPEILSDQKNNILICTHSNSAADIYIKEYLHDMRQGNRNIKPLRVYYSKRWRRAVHPDVLKYCLYEESMPGFNKPTMANIIDNNVIITTISTSFYLSALGIKPGFFTHIIIDEAAQIMECAALIPLSLANEKTRVILAGDYMQLGEEIFSEQCRNEGFSISLLERLFKYYPENHPCKILLRENYRSQELIVKLTSDLFYDGKICARSAELNHTTFKPLCFFAASGTDVQDKDSTSFCNQAEIREVSKVIQKIEAGWPMSWGPNDATAFGVITPYLDQVAKMRKYLKNQRKGYLSVERIYNVQGKEFKVTILSTVRTRKTCTQADDESDYGFMSNPKLLTTAITRAKYMVAIVGDPVALCTMGKCRNIWKEIVERCAKAESLYGVTLKELQNSLRANELQRIHGLNPLAKEFVPRAQACPEVFSTQRASAPRQPTTNVDLPMYLGTDGVPGSIPQRQTNQLQYEAAPIQRRNHIEYIAQQLSASQQATGHLNPPVEYISQPNARQPNQLELIAQQLQPSQQVIRQANPIEYIAQQITPGKPRQASQIEYIPQQQLISNTLELFNQPQANRQSDIQDIVPRGPGPAKMKPVSAACTMWESEQFKSIWSVKESSPICEQKTQQNVIASDHSRNSLAARRGLQPIQLDALRMRSALSGRPIEQVPAGMLTLQNPLVGQQGTLQLQPQSYQLAASPIGISNIILPPNPVPIVMPPSQQQTIAYTLPPNSHILSSPSFQTAPVFGNTDVLRHSMGRQEAQILSPIIAGTQTLTPNSGFGLSSSQVLHTSQVTPTRPSVNDMMSSPYKQGQYRQIPNPRDMYSSESASGLLRSSQSGIHPASFGNSKGTSEYLPQTATSPTSRAPFPLSNITSTPRSPHRSNKADGSVDNLFPNSQNALNYSAMSPTLPSNPPLPALSSDFLTAHGIPLPSNASMQIPTNQGMSIGQSRMASSFQNLQLGDAVGYSNQVGRAPFSVPATSTQTPRQNFGGQSRNLGPPTDLTFLEDLINQSKRP